MITIHMSGAQTLFDHPAYFLAYENGTDMLGRNTGKGLTFKKPNDIYICRTAALTSRRYILNIYSTNIHTEYFKHAA